jgi:hypothetical protein
MREALWARLVLHGLIVAVGLIGIVGSGGGGVGFPPCEPPLCPDTPPTPSVVVESTFATALVGGTVVFTAVVSNGAGLALQWRRSTDGGATYQVLAGANGGTLQVGPVNLADDGSLYDVSLQGTALFHATPARLAVSATPGIAFDDGEFVTTHWLRTEVPLFNQTTAPQYDDQREAAGGNSGAFRRMSARLSVPAGLAAVMYLWQDSVYDPSTQGAIRHLDHREDCIALNPSDVRGTEVKAALEQAGRLYESDLIGGLCLRNSWQTVQLGGLRASDFRLVAGTACGAGESCPDFSAAGAPMRFGHVRRNSGMAGDAVQHGIDNWRVTVWRR